MSRITLTSGKGQRNPTQMPSTEFGKIWRRHLRMFKNSIPLYVLMLPAILILILFHYVPMYGVQIAFRDFSIQGGITGSPWVGFKHFITFFQTPRFWTLVQNTLTLNLLSLATFPIPVILALMLNYCNLRRFKKSVQMITYAPHFISVVVLVSMIELFFSPSVGVVNYVIRMFGGTAIHFTAIPEAFKYLFVGSDVWQSTGWGSIIYIGTLASISPELHEAAIIDGATKMKRIWHVDLPGLTPTMIIMFIMRVGKLMNLGFQKVYLMQNDINITQSEVISTYVYKVGLVQSNFSYSTAIDLFNTFINIALLIVANQISKKLSETSLF